MRRDNVGLVLLFLEGGRGEPHESVATNRSGEPESESLLARLMTRGKQTEIQDDDDGGNTLLLWVTTHQPA